MRLHTPRESFLWLKTLWNHSRNLKKTRRELEEQQLRQFRRLVGHAQARSRYYRKVIAERGINPATCVPADFPVLTKDEVMANFDALVTDPRITLKRVSEFLERSTDPQELFEGSYHVLHTSGTSGSIGYFVFAHDEWIRGAAQVVRASPLRLRRRVAYVAATRGHYAGVSLMMAGNDGTNALFYNVRLFDIGQPLPAIIAQLNDFQPHALTGYAAAIKALAEAQERGDLRIRPRDVGNGGEPLLLDVKEFIERVFGVPVKNGYASSEHLYMAMPIHGFEGMHLLEDELIFELAPDHTCVTNLFNFTMPLIRYRMDDVLIPDDSTATALPFRRLKGVIGRREDSLVFRNQHGRQDFIHPITIVELVIAGLVGWQIVLTGDESFQFLARFDPALTSAERERTTERIAAKLREMLLEKEMSNVQFAIEPVESLAIDPDTGKFRLVVSARLQPELAVT
jgi:phenylacetate-coenzyme A ligase PaaK-like adenylate-forming protein